MTTVERPPDEEMERLVETHGRIRRRVVDWDLRDREANGDNPPCDGEVVLLLQDEEGRLAVVRKRAAPEHWLLPTGRIREGEPVEDAARREALEETGRTIRVEEIAALHRVRIQFRTSERERWFFVVLGSFLEAEGQPEDQEEIAEVAFVRLPSEMPVEWAQSEWYLWILKDGGLLHPHAFLLGKPATDSSEGFEGDPAA